MFQREYKIKIINIIFAILILLLISRNNIFALHQRIFIIEGKLINEKGRGIGEVRITAKIRGDKLGETGTSDDKKNKGVFKLEIFITGKYFYEKQNEFDIFFRKKGYDTKIEHIKENPALYIHICTTLRSGISTVSDLKNKKEPILINKNS